MKMSGSELKYMIRNNAKSWLKNTILVAFLFVLLNIFLGVGIYMNTVIEQAQKKLGVYLYLSDTTGNETEVYNKVIIMKKELEQQGAKINFVSKDDALGLLGKKIPGLKQNFEKFNIENPLQSTLYITFSDIKTYTKVKGIVEKYKTVIDNYKDVEKGTSLHSQDNRVVGMMKFGGFIQTLFYVVVVSLTVLVLFLMKAFLRNITQVFHKDLYRKKMMGAKRSEIIVPMLLYVEISMLLGIVLSILFTVGIGLLLNYYILQGFGVDSFTYIFSKEFLWAMSIEIIVVVVIGGLTSYSYLFKTNKSLK